MRIDRNRKRTIKKENEREEDKCTNKECEKSKQDDAILKAPNAMREEEDEEDKEEEKKV